MINKYRPNDIEQVQGHEQQLKTIDALLSGENVPHTWLFSGPSGIGKTTIARLIGKYICEDDHGLIEINGSLKNGIDDIKELIEIVRNPQLGLKNNNKFVIIDECQQLSKAAWSALFKITEEPPKHLYWCFCTTEIEKVPDSIKTRASKYALKALFKEELIRIYDQINQIEKINLSKKELDSLVEVSKGSARELINCLSQIKGLENTERLNFINNCVENIELIEIFRDIIKGLQWNKVKNYLYENKEKINPESFRISLFNYMNGYVKNEIKEENCIFYFKMMSVLNKPLYNAGTAFGELIMMIGAVYFDN